jgi:hypothetical protein
MFARVPMAMYLGGSCLLLMVYCGSCGDIMTTYIARYGGEGMVGDHSQLMGYKK